jgi:hypothetical protein
MTRRPTAIRLSGVAHPQGEKVLELVALCEPQLRDGW